MITLRDLFGSNDGWAEAAGGYVDSTQDVSNGVMSITSVTGYAESLWSKSGFTALDAIVVVRTSGASGDPQIHVRETDADNFLLVWIDTSAEEFVISKMVSGTLTELASYAIPNFSNSSDYYIAAKVFGNALHGILFDSDRKQIAILSEVSSDVTAQTGTKAGVGANGVASYSEFTCREAGIVTTLVCLGDSNTDGSPDRINQEDEFPQVINSRRIYDNLVCIEAGKAGDNIAECEARVATEVAPFAADGHRNVCVLQMGTNDRADGFTAAQAWTRYISCIQAVQAAGFVTFVNNGFPNTKDDADNTQWNEDLNADIAANEATYDYTAVDVWTPFGGTAGSGFPSDVDLLWYTQNNPHASEAGHLIFAEEDLKAVKRGNLELIT